ncbi:MAG TPA: DUF6057 family protein [Bacteroidales bacterium]|jgi:hypothetical protein|nr:DUF6057 family protein [Bacteroidales bacterium]
MENSKVVRIAGSLFTAIIPAGIYVFFAFFYNSHLHFEEQFRLFLFSRNYLTEKLILPGGLAGYLGEFFTQFYYISLIGPLVIALLLFALMMTLRRISMAVSSERIFLNLSCIPAIIAGMMLCNEFYPLSVVTGFLVATTAAMLFVRIKRNRERFITGIVLIPVVYWLAGGSFLSLLFIMLVFELLKGRSACKSRPESSKGYAGRWKMVSYLLVAAALPLMVHGLYLPEAGLSAVFGRFYYNVPGMITASIVILFFLPSVLMLISGIFRIKEKHAVKAMTVEILFIILFCYAGFRSYSNFEAEETMTYDYLVREGRWEDVLIYSEKHPPGNYLSLSMLNLSLSKTGQMGNNLFRYDQHGINGLFLSFNKEYVAPLLGNEIFYNLGLINASQQYAFESMETIPDMGKSARVLKRLAETNLINGQYEVSEKYLHILELTFFYRKWAKTTLTYLYDEEKINNNAEWGEKRRFLVIDDYFFHVQDIEAALNRMIREHPDNKPAFEYLMAFYLITKDLRHFSELIPAMEKMQYKRIPSSYQEAITFILASGNKDPITASPPYISQDTKQNLKAYADIYNNYPDAGQRLRQRFSATYWYYLHFNDYQYNPEEIIRKNLY